LSKLTPIEGGKSPDEMAQALRDIKKNMSTLIEYQAVMATLRFSCYEYCIKAGFTPDQALELAKKPL